MHCCEESLGKVLLPCLCRVLTDIQTAIMLLKNVGKCDCVFGTKGFRSIYLILRAIDF